MGEFISKETAREMIALYKQQKDSVLKPEFAAMGVLSLSETFDKIQVEKVLAQPGCVGMRIFYGMSPDNKVHAIIVGVNDQNEDILPDITTNSTGEEETGILDVAAQCPPTCSPSSDINP